MVPHGIMYCHIMTYNQFLCEVPHPITEGTSPNMTVHQTYCEVPSVIPDVPPYMTVDQTYFEYFCEYKVQTNLVHVVQDE